jgi:TPR repeat protein
MVVITDSQADKIDPRLADIHTRAKAGDVESQVLLGQIYCGGVAIGRDDLPGQMFSEPERAFYWFHQAAEQGNAESQTSIGTMLTKGEGTEVDHQEALRWFQAAVEQGNAEAMRRLGLAYAQGYGVERNLQETMKWWCLASEAGDCHAAFNMGMLYDGMIPELKNRAEALDWFQRASELGHPQAADAIENTLS